MAPPGSPKISTTPSRIRLSQSSCEPSSFRLISHTSELLLSRFFTNKKPVPWSRDGIFSKEEVPRYHPRSPRRGLSWLRGAGLYRGHRHALFAHRVEARCSEASSQVLMWRGLHLIPVRYHTLPATTPHQRSTSILIKHKQRSTGFRGVST